MTTPFGPEAPRRIVPGSPTWLARVIGTVTGKELGHHRRTPCVRAPARTCCRPTWRDPEDALEFIIACIHQSGRSRSRAPEGGQLCRPGEPPELEASTSSMY